MKIAQSAMALRSALKFHRSLPRSRYPSPLTQSHRYFRSFAALRGIKPHVLSDIGEGVKEVQIIQWFVEEGAAIEEWAPLCEVQSDKASVEISSKYSGVVKKLHFDRDAIVQVGDTMVDIEVEGEEGEPEEEPTEIEQSEETQETNAEDDTSGASQADASKDKPSEAPKEEKSETPEPPKKEKSEVSGADSNDATPGDSSRLATPAVRGMLKEHGLEITDIKGTGKDGRVLKEDVLKYIENGQDATETTQASQTTPTTAPTQSPKPELDAKQVETTQSLTAIQSAMFKTMTKSLSIPHFLFSDSINVTNLAAMRSRLNAARNTEITPKYSYLPFIIKAVSMALNHYPLLNGRVDLSDANKPKVMLRSNHNIGVAVDTPAGLLVPVIKNVNARSITSIAQELIRLSQLGQQGKLSNSDLSGGTITVSNIGSIGGEAVAPVIVEGQLAILGLGKIKATPIFAADGKTIERADMMSTSWSADHRVVDGATMARMATLIQKYLEQPESMLIDLS